MLSTQAVYALYSLVSFMKVKPITGTPHVCTTSGNSDSPVHLHVQCYSFFIPRQNTVNSYFKIKIDMKSVVLVFAQYI